MPLKLDSDPAQLDPLYQALVELEEGLDAEELELARSALLLLLAHQVGDLDTVREAMALARTAAREGGSPRPS